MIPLQAMIADLKADSQRWYEERDATLARSQQNSGTSDFEQARYRESIVHQFRHYYGPYETTSASTAGGRERESYPESLMATYGQPMSGYQVPVTQPHALAANYYIAGAAMLAPSTDTGLAAPVAQFPMPRSNIQVASSNVRPDSMTSYYSSLPEVGASTPVAASAAQPADPYYGRGKQYPPS